MTRRIFQRPSEELRVGDLIEVETRSLAYGGQAVARHHGLAVFIPLAAPNEKLRVRITERKPNFARAIIEEILCAGEARRQPLCRHFGDCGGCQLQHISYPHQLDAKVEFIRDSLRRIARFDWEDRIQMHHSNEYGYRSRAQIKLQRVGDRMLIGFNRAGSHDVCDVESCPALSPELDEALRLVRARVESRKDEQLPKEMEAASGDAGVSFEPSPEGMPQGAVEKKIGSFTYRFSPSTFFQSNALLLEELLSKAVGTRGGNLAIDLYAGVGLFTLKLAQSFSRVIGIEADARAVRFARENIRINRAENVEVRRAEVEKWIAEYAARRKKDAIDFLLLDPPRAGAAGAIEAITRLRPSIISYVSCDPATLARDLRALIDSGYALKRVSGFDLFPQTYHVETVAHLELV
jgi:23S rRNA (uracil1939-C5)-methyltransferase